MVSAAFNLTPVLAGVSVLTVSRINFSLSCLLGFVTNQGGFFSLSQTSNIASFAWVLQPWFVCVSLLVRFFFSFFFSFRSLGVTLGEWLSR